MACPVARQVPSGLAVHCPRNGASGWSASAKGALDILEQKNQVQIVGGTWLELGNQVPVEVPRRLQYDCPIVLFTFLVLCENSCVMDRLRNELHTQRRTHSRNGVETGVRGRS